MRAVAAVFRVAGREKRKGPGAFWMALPQIQNSHRPRQRFIVIVDGPNGNTGNPVPSHSC